MFISFLLHTLLHTLLLFHRMKTTNEGSVNNESYAWNKLDTDIADSPPVIENSDVPDLQRNRVRSNSLRLCFFRCKRDVNANIK